MQRITELEIRRIATGAPCSGEMREFLEGACRRWMPGGMLSDPAASLPDLMLLADYTRAVAGRDDALLAMLALRLLDRQVAEASRGRDEAIRAVHNAQVARAKDVAQSRLDEGRNVLAWIEAWERANHIELTTEAPGELIARCAAEGTHRVKGKMVPYSPVTVNNALKKRQRAARAL